VAAWKAYSQGVNITPKAVIINATNVNTVVGGHRGRRLRPVTDIFDSTRRKISKHISKEIAPSVFAEKEAEFKAKVREIAEQFLADPKLRKRTEAYLQYAAVEYMQKYFHSREFRKHCLEVAKGMVK
jgi:hypothetical protein